MKSEQFLELLENMEKEEKEILLCKGKEYARDDYKDDVLSNFKRIAKVLEVDPIKVWAIYFMKHIDAILNFVNTGEIISEESIKGRVADARNYLALGFALLYEKTLEGYFSAASKANPVLQGCPDKPYIDNVKISTRLHD